MNKLTVQLPLLKDQWAATLLQALYNQHPYLIVDSAKVNINDYALDDGVIGIIYVTMQNHRFGIPCIIRNGEAYPFDILLLPNGNVELLNKNNYEKLIAEIYQIATPAPKLDTIADLFTPKTSGHLPIDQVMTLDELTKQSSYRTLVFSEYDPEEFIKTAKEVFNVLPDAIKKFAKDLNLRYSKKDEDYTDDITEFEILEKTAGYQFIFYNLNKKVKEYVKGKGGLEKIAENFDINDEELELLQRTKYAKFKKNATDFYIDHEITEKPKITIIKMAGDKEVRDNVDFLIKPSEPKVGTRMVFFEKGANDELYFTEPIYITKVEKDKLEGYSSEGFVKLKETDKNFIKNAAVPESKTYLLSTNALPFEAVDKKQYDVSNKYQQLLKTASYNKLKIHKAPSAYIVDDSKILKNLNDVDVYLMKEAGFDARDTLYINQHLESLPPSNSIVINYKHNDHEKIAEHKDETIEIPKEDKKALIKFATYYLHANEQGLFKLAQTPKETKSNQKQKGTQPQEQVMTSRELLDYALKQDPDEAIAYNLLELTASKKLNVSELIMQYQLLENSKNVLIKLLLQAEVGLLPIKFDIVRNALIALENLLLSIEYLVNQSQTTEK